MDACRALGTTAWLVGGRDVRSRVAYLFMFLVLQYLRQLRNANSVTPKKKASVTPPMQSKVEGVCASLYISATPDRLRQTLSLTEYKWASRRPDLPRQGFRRQRGPWRKTIGEERQPRNLLPAPQPPPKQESPTEGLHRCQHCPGLFICTTYKKCRLGELVTER